jgi:hypothetical protein
MPSFGPNIPSEQLRWSIDAASPEFRISRMTLRKYLADIGARPDPAGCYSTAQITAALYGDLHTARVRLARAQHRRISLANAVTSGSVVDRSMLAAGLAAIADAMTARVRASNLDRMAQDDLLKELAGTGSVLERVIREQSALRRQHNGEEEEDDDLDDDLDPDDVAASRPARKTAKTHFRQKPGFVKAS